MRLRLNELNQLQNLLAIEILLLLLRGTEAFGIGLGQSRARGPADSSRSLCRSQARGLRLVERVDNELRHQRAEDLLRNQPRLVRV